MADSRGFAVAVVALVMVASAHIANAQLSNPVVDWLKATQATVAAQGIPNQLASTYYANVALSQYKALDLLSRNTSAPAVAAAINKTATNASLEVAVQGELHLLLPLSSSNLHPNLMHWLFSTLLN
jgi:hypothetical protein